MHHCSFRNHLSVKPEKSPLAHENKSSSARPGDLLNPILRSEKVKVQDEKFPNFSNFRPELCSEKKPQRKDFGGRYGFLVLIGLLYPHPAWKVFLWGQKKSSSNNFFLVVVVYAFSSLLVSTALLLNEVSEKSRKIWNEVSEIFSEICPEIFRAFLAGRKVHPKIFTRFFPSEISNFKSNSKANFTKNFTNTLLQAWQP